MVKYERFLQILLRGAGATCMLAIFPVFMPMAWMDSCHRMLALGPMPQGPIVEYLARSTSALYAFLGVVMWLAGDVRRYGGLVSLLGVAWTVFGFLIVYLDTSAGLPAWWTAGEGLSTIGMGICILALQRMAGKT